MSHISAIPACLSTYHGFSFLCPCYWVICCCVQGNRVEGQAVNMEKAKADAMVCVAIFIVY